VNGEHLRRSGGGKIVYRDYVELNNFQRLILLDEEVSMQRVAAAIRTADKRVKVY